MSTTGVVTIRTAAGPRTYPVQRTAAGRVQAMRPVEGTWMWVPLTAAVAARVQWDAA